MINILERSKGLEAVAMEVVRRFFNGQREALTDLSYQSRRKYLKEYPLDTTRVKTISFTSSVGTAKSLMGPMASFLEKNEVKRFLFCLFCCLIQIY